MSNPAAALSRNSPSTTASGSAEAAASDSDPSDLPPFQRHDAVGRERVLHDRARAVLSGFSKCRSPSARGKQAMPEPDRIVRLRTVLSRTGLSRSTMYRKIAEGTFPAQVKISINGAGWHESEINRWVENPASWRPLRDGDKI